MSKRNKTILLCTILLLSVTGGMLIWENQKTDHWSITIKGVGSHSSCRAADLNGDGHLDIVVGGGKQEYESTQYAVMAIDGRDGSLLWKVPGRNQMVGSAIFHDLDGDGQQDVIIGGRSAQLMAISGKMGNKIWEYRPNTDSMDMVNDTTLLNFFNPQWIGDQNGDRIMDLLVSFGGFVNAGPDNRDRPSGKLMVFSGATGELLAEALMPDRKETYCSPVVYDFNGDGNVEIVFGSGGETINGALYISDVQKLMSGNIDDAKVLSTGEGKGFIAPPILSDVTLDGILDIIAQSYNGRMIAIDGSDFSLIWEYRVEGQAETYSCVAPTDINSDGVLDFFGSFGRGAWPNTKNSIQVMVNGKTGQLIHSDSLGSFQYASPLPFDFTGDGIDDILYSINTFSEPAWKDSKDGGTTPIYRYSTELMVYDMVEKTTYNIGGRRHGTNLGSTPLLSDLDNDGKLDIVTCHMTDAFDFFAYRDLVIERIEINHTSKNVHFGAYMGNAYNGIYKK